MTNGLEIPLHFSGLGIQRDQSVAEQIRARAVAAVEVRARPADGIVDDAVLFVDRERESPDVVAGAILPAVLGPGIVARLRPSCGKVWNVHSSLPVRTS